MRLSWGALWPLLVTPLLPPGGSLLWSSLPGYLVKVVKLPTDAIARLAQEKKTLELQVILLEIKLQALEKESPPVQSLP